ncbi:MAG: hypothetical protein JNIBNLAF_01272 [Nitrosomonas europaea]|nr:MULTISPECIES: hypothetical protein [Nitrosomonas]MBV6389625.1 hypothetical protein [Nitrosomonas europaea]
MSILQNDVQAEFNILSSLSSTGNVRELQQAAAQSGNVASLLA